MTPSICFVENHSRGNGTPHAVRVAPPSSFTGNHT